MATVIKRTGFGQVEPNHLSAQQTGQIYAQLPVDTSVSALSDHIENGQFLKYDYEAGKCDLTGDGEWMLVLNEIKLYDNRAFRYKDYAMKVSDYVDGQIVPRLFKTNVGDIYTTNCLGAAVNSKDAELATTATGALSLSVGDTLKVNASTGFLTPATTADKEFLWNVVKIYTMPDGQPGVKLQRIV